MEGIEKSVTVRTPTKDSSVDLSWLAVVAILALLAIVGSPVSLECERAVTHGPVHCTKQTRLLWVIRLSPEQVSEVRGAHLASVPGDEYCDPCYRVELETAQGIVPLKAMYTSGNSDMSIVVDKVNDFVHSGSPGKLAVTEPSLLSFENLYCFVGWLILVTAGSYIWEKIKSAFGRGRNG